MVAHQPQRRAVDGNIRLSSAGGPARKRNSRCTDPKDLLLRDEHQPLDQDERGSKKNGLSSKDKDGPEEAIRQGKGGHQESNGEMRAPGAIRRRILQQGQPQGLLKDNEKVAGGVRDNAGTQPLKSKRK